MPLTCKNPCIEMFYAKISERYLLLCFYVIFHAVHHHHQEQSSIRRLVTMTLHLLLSSDILFALPMLWDPLYSFTSSPQVFLCLPLSLFPSIIPSRTSLGSNPDDPLMICHAITQLLLLKRASSPNCINKYIFTP